MNKFQKTYKDLHKDDLDQSKWEAEYENYLKDHKFKRAQQGGIIRQWLMRQKMTLEERKKYFSELGKKSGLARKKTQ
jgi:hypothetical protein